MEIKGNKGEWSELYVFLKLLAEGKLYAADANLTRIDDMFFPILKIIREETGKKKEFLTKDSVIVCVNDEKTFEIPVESFSEQAEHLLSTIKSTKTSPFASEKIEEFMKIISINSLESRGRDKADIMIQIHDIQTGYQPEVGFSIKSKLGSPATLLNASKATNFVFEVIGNTEYVSSNLEEIQGVCHPNGSKKSDSPKDIIERLSNNGCYLQYIKTDDRFDDNLMLIDSQMSTILSYFILAFYSGSVKNTMPSILEYVVSKNPLNLKVEKAENFYGHKIKSMLCAVALGMMPSIEWNGTDEATGGYIIVKQDGEIVAYHIYNRDKFKDYLLSNTKFDSPQRFDSPSPSKKKGFDYGYVYEDNGKFYMKLNLQIRFA
jgi:type II restriction enzyme